MSKHHASSILSEQVRAYCRTLVVAGTKGPMLVTAQERLPTKASGQTADPPPSLRDAILKQRKRDEG